MVVFDLLDSLTLLWPVRLRLVERRLLISCFDSRRLLLACSVFAAACVKDHLWIVSRLERA